MWTEIPLSFERLRRRKRDWQSAAVTLEIPAVRDAVLPFLHFILFEGCTKAPGESRFYVLILAESRLKAVEKILAVISYHFHDKSQQAPDPFVTRAVGRQLRSSGVRSAQLEYQ